MRPKATATELFHRTVASMSDDECAAALPHLKRWLAVYHTPATRRFDQDDGHTAKPEEGAEIVRFSVDTENCIRAARVTDPTRLPLGKRVNDLVDRDVTALGTVPAETLSTMVARCRDTGRLEWVCWDSVFYAGERRMAVAQPHTRRKGWLDVRIFFVNDTPVT